MLVIGFGFILPRWFDVFVPVERRGEAHGPTVPGVTIGEELTASATNTDGVYGNGHEAGYGGKTGY